MRYIEVIWVNGETEEKISFMAVDPETYTQVSRFIYNEPLVAEDLAISQLAAGNSIFISSVIAEKYSLGPGDKIRIKTRESEQSFNVAAVVIDFYNQGLVVTGCWSDLKRYFDIN